LEGTFDHLQSKVPAKSPVVGRPVERVRSGLALLAVSVTVGVVTAGLVAVAIALAALALRRAVG
jgi:hypothetical protein